MGYEGRIHMLPPQGFQALYPVATALQLTQ